LRRQPHGPNIGSSVRPAVSQARFSWAATEPTDPKDHLATPTYQNDLTTSGRASSSLTPLSRVPRTKLGSCRQVTISLNKIEGKHLIPDVILPTSPLSICPYLHELTISSTTFGMEKDKFLEDLRYRCCPIPAPFFGGSPRVN